jgi:DNA-binding winged helix-turn-helix (wHTH) protein
MRVAFGTFIFDSDQRSLDREGSPVHVSPKAFRLLECLIEAAPAAVSREALYEQIWGETFVVDANLPNLVSEIRAALGDSHQSPRYIRTIHRHGYAFIGDVAGARHSTSRLSVEWGSASWPLQQGVNVIGRDDSAAVTVDSAGVSRTHAAIVVRGGTATIEDRGSKNGTYVGSDKLDGPRELASGDVIRLGSVRLTFRAATRPDSTLTEHVASLDDAMPCAGGTARSEGQSRRRRKT